MNITMNITMDITMDITTGITMDVYAPIGTIYSEYALTARPTHYGRII